jgi:hypothetical protein
VQAHETEDAPATQAKPLLRRAHVQDSPPRARQFNWGPGAESPTAAPTCWSDPTAAPSPLTATAAPTRRTATAAPTHRHRHHTRNPTWTTPTAAPTPIDVVVVGTFSTLGFGSASFSSSGTVFPAGLSFSLSGNVAPIFLSFSATFSAAPFVPTAAPTAAPTVPVDPLTPGVDAFSQAGLSTQAFSTPVGFSTQAFSFDYSTSQPAVAFSTAAFSAFGLSSSVSLGGIGGGDAFGSADPIAAVPF